MSLNLFEKFLDLVSGPLSLSLSLSLSHTSFLFILRFSVFPIRESSVEWHFLHSVAAQIGTLKKSEIGDQ